MYLITLLLAMLLAHVQSARILCVFPVPSISHQIVFRELTKELTKLGHELVIVTPNPHLPIDRPRDNVTEIDVSFIYKSLGGIMIKIAQRNLLIRGAAIDIENFDNDLFIELIENLVVKEFKHPPVKEVLNDPNQHFDLIILEAIYEYSLILSTIFKAPTIMISSFYGTPENLDAVGAINRHPILYPNYNRSRFASGTIWEKLYGIYKEWKLYSVFQKIEKSLDQLLKQNYGSDAPTIRDLRNNIDLLFINSHPIYDGNRPVPPNVIYLGSLHLQPVQELPKDLKSFMDNSKNGVVYVSLGTNVHTSMMDHDLIEAFLNAFESLPYDFIWKYNGELETKPNNLRIKKWVPQRDLLTHPKLKLFVTQGGRQSLDEAIDAGVPMVAMPAFGDQIFNVKKSVELGICKELSLKKVNRENFIEAIQTVIKDVSYYKKNIENLRTIYNDQSQKPIEKAIWWTEYVLRHGGAKHLRSPLANISWSEYLMLDVVVTVAATVVAALAILIIVFQRFIKQINQKNKTD